MNYGNLERECMSDTENKSLPWANSSIVEGKTVTYNN